MPFANHQGVKIYYEVEEQGSPIILAHGVSGDTTFWRGYGYVDRLKAKYTVIPFDARGHGKSDKPHEVESYDYRLMVGDVIAVLNAIGVNRTHYWGYSMGGIIGFGLVKHFPERLMSLIAGGVTPYGAPKQNEPKPLLKVFKRGAKEGEDALVEGMKELAGSITSQYEERLRSLDIQAMVACLEYAQYQRPSFEDDVPQIKLPCLFYSGDADAKSHEFGKEAAQQMPEARYFSLPGLNHVGASSATEQIIPQVLTFLADLEISRNTR
jgi:pimeloyl-ACP methyl ester carboxylesterase